MPLLNVDGLTVVGQGSEWFWAMLQVLLLVATFVVVARQLRAQAAANAQARIESLWADWNTYDAQYRRLVLALHLRSDGVQGKAWPGSVTWEKAQPIVVYMGNVAYLVNRGHVAIDEVAGFIIPFRLWTAALRPFFEVAGSNIPGVAEDLVELIHRFDAWDRKHGQVQPTMSNEGWLDDVIDRTTQNLRLEQDRRAGVIPGRPAVAADGG
jgi:hypothetical protein